jgi:nucleotide-binding universal stress UspA family protein
VIEIRTILCPFDFSEYSRRAFDQAVAIARRYGATIAVLHVFPTLPSVAYAGGMIPAEAVALSDEDRAALLDHLRQFLHLDASGLPVTTPLIREGEPASAILECAAELKTGLIVLGTHGRSGFERLVLGSVTEKVLRKAACPVLTVPRLQPEVVPALPALFKNILCPVDFSGCSMSALEYAALLAQEADATLTIVHVVANVLDDWPGLQDFDAVDERLSVAELFAKREDEARRQLAAALATHTSDFCEIKTAILRGTSGPAILRFAAAHRNDLIVMGVQGRPAADLMVFGSTTQHVVRQAVCPVLTIRSR